MKFNRSGSIFEFTIILTRWIRHNFQRRHGRWRCRKVKSDRCDAIWTSLEPVWQDGRIICPIFGNLWTWIFDQFGQIAIEESNFCQLLNYPSKICQSVQNFTKFGHTGWKGTQWMIDPTQFLRHWKKIEAQSFFAFLTTVAAADKIASDDENVKCWAVWPRLGDILDLGQLFKVFGNN